MLVSTVLVPVVVAPSAAANGGFWLFDAFAIRGVVLSPYRFIGSEVWGIVAPVDRGLFNPFDDCSVVIFPVVMACQFCRYSCHDNYIDMWGTFSIAEKEIPIDEHLSIARVKEVEVNYICIHRFVMKQQYQKQQIAYNSWLLCNEYIVEGDMFFVLRMERHDVQDWKRYWRGR